MHSLNIRKTFELILLIIKLLAASLITITLPVGESYLPFTDERYTLIRSDGLIEVLTADKFTLVLMEEKCKLEILEQMILEQN